MPAAEEVETSVEIASDASSGNRLTLVTYCVLPDTLHISRGWSVPREYTVFYLI